jgi:hypothetical protein
MYGLILQGKIIQSILSSKWVFFCLSLGMSSAYPGTLDRLLATAFRRLFGLQLPDVRQDDQSLERREPSNEPSNATTPRDPRSTTKTDTTPPPSEQSVTECSPPSERPVPCQATATSLPASGPAVDGLLVLPPPAPADNQWPRPVWQASFDVSTRPVFHVRRGNDTAPPLPPPPPGQTTPPPTCGWGGDFVPLPSIFRFPSPDTPPATRTFQVGEPPRLSWKQLSRLDLPTMHQVLHDRTLLLVANPTVAHGRTASHQHHRRVPVSLPADGIGALGPRGLDLWKKSPGLTAGLAWCTPKAHGHRRLLSFSGEVLWETDCRDRRPGGPAVTLLEAPGLVQALRAAGVHEAVWDTERMPCDAEQNLPLVFCAFDLFVIRLTGMALAQLRLTPGCAESSQRTGRDPLPLPETGILYHLPLQDRVRVLRWLESHLQQSWPTGADGRDTRPRVQLGFKPWLDLRREDMRVAVSHLFFPATGPHPTSWAWDQRCLGSTVTSHRLAMDGLVLAHPLAPGGVGAHAVVQPRDLANLPPGDRALALEWHQAWLATREDILQAQRRLFPPPHEAKSGTIPFVVVCKWKPVPSADLQVHWPQGGWVAGPNLMASTRKGEARVYASEGRGSKRLVGWLATKHLEQAPFQQHPGSILECEILRLPEGRDRTQQNQTEWVPIAIRVDKEQPNFCLTVAQVVATAQVLQSSVSQEDTLRALTVVDRFT